MRQLARIVLAGTSGSPDEQDATPDERGSYGELMDEIDRLFSRDQAEGKDRSEPSWRPPGPSRAACEFPSDEHRVRRK